MCSFLLVLFPALSSSFNLFFLLNAVFGVSLQTAVYRSQLGADGLKLPTVFRECIDYLEENGKTQPHTDYRKTCILFLTS